LENGASTHHYWVQVGRKVIEEDAGITGLKSVDLFFFFIFTTAELNLLHGASSLMAVATVTPPL